MTLRRTPSQEKADVNRAHAARRALERYGIQLSGPVTAEIEGLIRNHDPRAVLLRDDHRGRARSLYAVDYDGRWLAVAYDDAVKSLVSFLPEEVLDDHRHVFEAPPVVEKVVLLGSDPLKGLPGVPDLNVDSPDDAIEAALAALADRRIEAASRYRDGKKTAKWNQTLNEELERIAEVKRAIKQQRAAVRLMKTPTTGGV